MQQSESAEPGEHDHVGEHDNGDNGEAANESGGDSFEPIYNAL